MFKNEGLFTGCFEYCLQLFIISLLAYLRKWLFFSFFFCILVGFFFVFVVLNNHVLLLALLLLLSSLNDECLCRFLVSLPQISFECRTEVDWLIMDALHERLFKCFSLYILYSHSRKPKTHAKLCFCWKTSWDFSYVFKTITATTK